MEKEEKDIFKGDCGLLFEICLDKEEGSLNSSVHAGVWRVGNNNSEFLWKRMNSCRYENPLSCIYHRRINKQNSFAY